MALAHRKKFFLSLGALLVLTLAIPVTLSMIQKQQETQSQAQATTSMYFTPASSSSSAIQKSVGDTFSLDVMINPGSNLVTFVRFRIVYDPTKLELVTSNPFAVNTTAFPNQVEGPILGTGSLAESLSVGSDPTKSIQTITKIGTLNFKAIGGTGSSTTEVNFDALTQVLSAGSQDQASENVLATRSAAVIAIDGSGTPSASGTAISFTTLLHGVGAAGDNPNPTGNTLSNKNPLHPQRNLNVTIMDSNNQLVASKTGTLTYASASGNFTGSIDLGDSFAEGSYIIKVQSDRYLKKLVPGIQTITKDQDNKMPIINLVAGDINADNSLNILDYNGFLDCGYGAINPLPMDNEDSIYHTTECQAHTPTINVDINDDGVIDSTDYNLFLRELSVQNGD